MGDATPTSGWQRCCGPQAAASAATAGLGVLIPEAQLLLGHVEIEAVLLLAAADAALVGCRPVAAVAVFEHARVPGQAQAVVADAGLPVVPHLHTARQQHLL